jgi:hypothetical protein
MRRWLPYLVTLVLLVPFAPSFAAGLLDTRMAFSAERTVTVNGRSYSGTLYHTAGRERHDQDLFGMHEVFILNAASEQGWLVMPDLKTYLEFPFPPVMAALADQSLAKTPVGEEPISGIPTTKYRVSWTAPDGTAAKGFLWLSHRGVLMKLDGTVTRPGGKTLALGMQLSGLKEGPQDPQLFALPAGFTRLPVEALGSLLGGNSR